MSAAESFEPIRDGSEWRELAACKGQTKQFFAKKAERPEARARREAKAQAVCDACPVQVQCRDFARTHHEYGYWGGESEEERHFAGYTLTAPIGARVRLMREQDQAAELDHVTGQDERRVGG